MAENDSSSVVVLLDVSAAGWTSAVASETGGKLTLKACVEAVVVFVNAVQLLDRRNHVALVRALPHHPVPSPFSMIRLSGASFTISCGGVVSVVVRASGLCSSRGSGHCCCFELLASPIPSHTAIDQVVEFRLRRPLSMGLLGGGTTRLLPLPVPHAAHGRWGSCWHRGGASRCDGGRAGMLPASRSVVVASTLVASVAS